MEKLSSAEKERNYTPECDIDKIEDILKAGWDEIYNSLDDESKRAFWRSFIRSIKVEWVGKENRIKTIIFLRNDVLT